MLIAKIYHVFVLGKHFAVIQFMREIFLLKALDMSAY